MTQASRRADYFWVCLQPKCQPSTLLAMLLFPEQLFPHTRGLLVAQVLLQVTAKLAQQAFFLAFCENASASSLLLCLANWILRDKPVLLCQTALGPCLLTAFTCYKAVKVVSCLQQFVGQSPVTVNATAASVTDDVCRRGYNGRRTRWR